ncbi:hypothetical protein LIN78_05055 [Leeia sp. TBRC 13508]|uniref:Chorismatase FkbO/Hyg5-like N-terminal domain-containing protein n=1 Tax=Leeia speluncae TaxID=2884804 RepID=A0ABS8D421_9NEIS|nr:hypothetical protein [Leeia speluncae]MCB6182916.1 hypothetical protein [Leeia speluncae]
MPLLFTHSAKDIANRHLLGAASTQDVSPSATQSTPFQTLHMPVLGQSAQEAGEFWLVEKACQAAQFGDIRYQWNEDFLFGVVELDEHSIHATDTHPLQVLAEKAYLQIFELLDQTGFPHIWRVWNYMPAINQQENGVERYRWFNIGRHEAFNKTQREVSFSPAACALGSHNGPLSIAFLAAKTPTKRIENPRQVSAFNYPSEYGPKSPTFTRAALAALNGKHILFISGTASIVNHHTVHIGDIVGQTQETFTNIHTLVNEANTLIRHPAFAMNQLYYKVYIRHPQHFALVKEIVEKTVGNAAVQYVQADICRQDLLVEIEAHGINRSQIN